MFNFANCHFQRGFSRGRYFKRLGTKARFVCDRGPGRFCFSWRSRHLLTAELEGAERPARKLA